MGATKKKNREALRKLMGGYDISASKVAAILGVRVSTVHQYRAISGQDISNKDLDYLRYKLGDVYGESE
jgi:hypothetical protein